jgi:TPR repeat protein
MLQRAASNGRREALAPRGDLFLAGAAGPKDRTRAASVYAQAAAYGDADAAYAAGILYADGDPDPMDDPLKAIGFLRQAAQAGRADASADYGLMLYQGRGVARDLKGAAQWFKAAAEGGDLDGAFYWALVNAKAEGTPQNLELAVQWARVAKGSSPDADRLLAQLEAIAAKPKPAASKP